MTYAEVLTTITTVIAILGYLLERNKREKINAEKTEANTKLSVIQESNQQVKNNLQQVTNIITNKTSLTQEDIKSIAQEITSATSNTANTIAITSQPIAFANPITENIARAKAIAKEYQALDKFIKEHPGLQTPEQAFELWKEKQKP